MYKVATRVRTFVRVRVSSDQGICKTKTTFNMYVGFVSECYNNLAKI